MVKHVNNEFRGLEERGHREENVRKDEVNTNLNIVEMLLQEQKNDKDQQCGWELKKRVKWYVRELYERKLMQRLSTWLNMVEEEISEVEYEKGFISEEVEVYICEL